MENGRFRLMLSAMEICEILKILSLLTFKHKQTNIHNRWAWILYCIVLTHFIHMFQIQIFLWTKHFSHVVSEQISDWMNLNDSNSVFIRLKRSVVPCVRMPRIRKSKFKMLHDCERGNDTWVINVLMSVAHGFAIHPYEIYIAKNSRMNSINFTWIRIFAAYMNEYKCFAWINALRWKLVHRRWYLEINKIKMSKSIPST